MPRPLSQLVYLVDREAVRPDAPQVIVLHDRQGRATDGIAAAAPLRDRASLVAVEASKGIWVGRTIAGFTWYLGDPDRPAPLAFGVSLSEIECFLIDTLDRREPGDDRLPLMLGFGQGGTMALAAAAARPDLLSGVIAVDARFPDVPGWEPPLAPLDGLPILLLEPDTARDDDGVASRFAGWGANVVRSTAAGAEQLAEALREWVEINAGHRTGDGRE